MQAENAHQIEQTLATLTLDCLFEDLVLGQVFRGHAGERMYWDVSTLLRQFGVPALPTTRVG